MRAVGGASPYTIETPHWICFRQNKRAANLLPFLSYKCIFIFLALYHQYWIAVKIRLYSLRIFVCILEYLV